MKKNRSILKDYFKKGATPTESDFADLIDSMLNQEEDNIDKLPNAPLSVTAIGADETLLNFYRIDQNEKKLGWQLAQKPGGKVGLSISDGTAGRLFIESGTGNVGIGTDQPKQTLDVRGRINIENGVIQRGGDKAITATSDLGLYSQVDKNWIRIVSTNAPIRFYTDGGAGTNMSLSIEAGGGVLLANSDLYFTKTDHNHTAFGNTAGYAAIENAKNFDALMIIGRSGTDKGRKVKLWDYLQVNGELHVTGAQNIIRVKTFTLAIKNAGKDSPGKWSVDYSELKFSEVYAVFVSLQGYSLWNNQDKTDFSAWGHVAGAGAIPQHTYVRVTGQNTEKAEGLAYCSESDAAAEVDNSVLFTVVVMGRV